MASHNANFFLFYLLQLLNMKSEFQDIFSVPRKCIWFDLIWQKHASIWPAIRHIAMKTFIIFIILFKCNCEMTICEDKIPRKMFRIYFILFYFILKTETFYMASHNAN